MLKKTREMHYAAAFKLPTAAITTAQRLGVLPKTLPPLDKIEMEDRHFLDAFGRCYKNTGFITGGLAELSPSKREQLKARLQGWKAGANEEYERLYLAEIEGHDYGKTIREVTTELKERLFLTPEQHGELDAIRRAAKGRMQREVARDKKEGYR